MQKPKPADTPGHKQAAGSPPRRPVDRRYLDLSLPLEERVDGLVSQLTLREQIAQLMHAAPPVPRLDIPAYNWWNECLHGVARAGKATVFPQAIGMAASFNPGLVRRIASAIATEARAKHHQGARQGQRGMYFGLTYWTPNINIFRHPLWGRGQETYGEDPHLTARMGVAFCRGLQGRDPRYLKVVATPKHFAVHSGPEHLRHEFNAVVTQRDLHETYLPAFKACVHEARAGSVMAAYNRTNGEPCCGSPTLLQHILRDTWGFDGYVVSDCWALRDFHQYHGVTRDAAESAALALRHGCDLNCGNVYRSLLDAVRRGLIDRATIARSVKRLFLARFKLGLFDPDGQVPYAHIPPETVGCRRHRALALRAARQSLVLLENKKGILPLRKDLRSLAVAGPRAFDAKMQLANYFGLSDRVVTILEGIVGAVSPGTRVTYARGCDPDGSAPVFEGDLRNLLADAPEAIIAVLGNSADIEGEQAGSANSDGGGDRDSLALPGRQQEFLEKLVAAGAPVILILTAGSAVDLNWAREHCAAILVCWYPGEAGGIAVAETLFGDNNPAGRLPVTFPKALSDLPPFEDYAMAHGHTYRFLRSPPLYRFGYGLSYTTFAYGAPRLSRSRIAGHEPVTVSVEVTNTGRRPGDEVVQCYVADLEASVPVPRWHLEAFRRITLAPGATQKVAFRLSPSAWTCYDGGGRAMVEPGRFRITLGGGQPDDPRLPHKAVELEIGTSPAKRRKQ